MKTLNLVASEGMANLFNMLRSNLGVGDDIDVIRKALAIARLCVEQGQKSGGVIVIHSVSRPDDGVTLDLRS